MEAPVDELVVELGEVEVEPGASTICKPTSQHVLPLGEVGFVVL